MKKGVLLHFVEKFRVDCLSVQKARYAHCHQCIEYIRTARPQFDLEEVHITRVIDLRMRNETACKTIYTFPEPRARYEHEILTGKYKITQCLSLPGLGLVRVESCNCLINYIHLNKCALFNGLRMIFCARFSCSEETRRASEIAICSCDLSIQASRVN